jgi:acyl-CoA dehydrogenase
VDHLKGRMLYGKPVIDMPHIRSRAAQAYVRLTAMKMFAYRALDYFQAATAADRRYLLFAAVQKARVSTEGVKVVALLAECVGAKGFEADTYFEMALRDVQLIPGLEGSTHINLGLAAQFIPGYFGRSDDGIVDPASLVAGQAAAAENPYLMEARTGPLNTIAFPHFLRAYRPLAAMIPNVRLFAKQAKAFALFVRHASPQEIGGGGTQRALALGQCLATIAYGQLIAESAVLLGVPPEVVSVVFHLLVVDLAGAVITLASASEPGAAERLLIRRTALVPETAQGDWDFVAGRFTASSR